MKRYSALLCIIVFILGIVTVRDYLIKSRSSQQNKNISESVSKPNQSTLSVQISFSNIKIVTEIAQTAEKRELGLSYRTTLDKNAGMLFVFENPNIPFFWMKDMNFPLDIIWIKDNKVIDIDKNVPIPKENTPLNQLPKYSPSGMVNYALEVNAGFADKNKIKVGDEVGIIIN
jgi:uncharacterized protein